jgi:hypothetical protein
VGRYAALCKALHKSFCSFPSERYRLISLFLYWTSTQQACPGCRQGIAIIAPPQPRAAYLFFQATLWTRNTPLSHAVLVHVQDNGCPTCAAVNCNCLRRYVADKRAGNGRCLGRICEFLPWLWKTVWVPWLLFLLSASLSSSSLLDSDPEMLTICILQKLNPSPRICSYRPV